MRQRGPDRGRLRRPRVRPGRDLHAGQLTSASSPCRTTSRQRRRVRRGGRRALDVRGGPRANDELCEFARGTDLLMIEATLLAPERVGMRGHLTAEEAGEHAAGAGGAGPDHAFQGRARPRGRRKRPSGRSAPRRAGARGGLVGRSERSAATGPQEEWPIADQGGADPMPKLTLMDRAGHNHSRWRATALAPAVRALRGRAPRHGTHRRRHRRRRAAAGRPRMGDRLKSVMGALSHSERACLFAVRLADEQTLPSRPRRCWTGADRLVPRVPLRTGRCSRTSSRSSS